MKLHILSLALLSCCPLFAQDPYGEALQSIEQNNLTLKALRETAHAEKLDNRSDLFLSDPELGFNYLWGHPGGIGDRKDFSVSQSFDLATLSGRKSRLATQKNEMVEWQYQADRMNILLEAKVCLIDLTYYNGLLQLLQTQLSQADSLVVYQKKRLDCGEGNILEYNNVILNRSQVWAERQRVEVEQKALLSQIAQLNGGIALPVTLSHYENRDLPTDFQAWWAVAETKNPVLAYVRSDVERNKKQLSVNKAMNLPSLSVGYMSENTKGQAYRGISVGVSIPLWSNRNRVRQAQAAVVAAEARSADATSQLYSQLEILYQKAEGLRLTALTYRQALQEADNTLLLQKALQAGEISIIDYLKQISLYYESADKALAAERDYQKALAELSAFEL